MKVAQNSQNYRFLHSLSFWKELWVILFEQMRYEFCRNLFNSQLFCKCFTQIDSHSYLSYFVNNLTMIFIDCMVNFSKLSSFQFIENQPDHSWSLSEILIHFKCKCHSYTCAFPNASSLKAVWNIITVSAGISWQDNTSLCSFFFFFFYQPP